MGFASLYPSYSTAVSLELGYAEMKLDTLPWLTEAIGLYQRFGFVEIAPYYNNPVPGTRYLSKRLRP